MIINYYLADKNTTEMFKVSGSYKFDSWIKYYTIKVTIQLNNDEVFPVDKSVIKGEFKYLVNEEEYTETITFTNAINTTGALEFVLYEGTERPSKIDNTYALLLSTSDTDLENHLDEFFYVSVLETTVEHTCGVETNIDYLFEEATIGKYYKVQYTVTGDSQYGVYLMVGTNKGNVVQSAGTYTEYLKMTDINKISFFASGLVTISDFSIEEYVVIADPLDFSDKDAFINYSWTLSYSMDLNNWVSFHSYIPDYYLTTNNYLYSLVNDDLSIEYTIRDEDNNYITGNENETIIYYTYTYD